MQMSGVQCDSLTLTNKESEKHLPQHVSTTAAEVVLFINKPYYLK